MFSDRFPILLTTDVARALAFYRDQLGAVVTFEYPGSDGAPAYVGHADQPWGERIARVLDPDGN